MTLFVSFSRYDRYEISDAYVMVLGFITGFLTIKIIKRRTEKQREEQKRAVKISNPRGGGIEFRVSDDHELADIILWCVEDNKEYLVIDKTLKQVLFDLVKAKIKHESLVLTPNLIRFLALNIKHNKQNVVEKVGNVILSSDNPKRLLIRVVGSVIFGALAYATTGVGYGIFMMILYFDLTSNCGFYRCSDYFQEIYQAERGKFHAERPHGNIAIAENAERGQVEIYVPTNYEQIITNSLLVRTYKPAPKKPRPLTFLEYIKSHPVLSIVGNIEEPYVPKGTCPITEVHEVLAVRGGFQKNTIRWQKIEEKIVLIIGFIALALSKIPLNSQKISASNIDNYLITKSTNTNIVHLQKQMVFENFDLEKISGKKEYQNRIVIQIGDIQIHEKLSEKEQQKMVKMLEQDLHHTAKISKNLNQINVNSKLARKTKRRRMKTINDLAPLNFKNEDIIKTTYDPNTNSIKIKNHF